MYTYLTGCDRSKQNTQVSQYYAMVVWGTQWNSRSITDAQVIQTSNAGSVPCVAEFYVSQP